MTTSRRDFAKSIVVLAACPPLVPFANRLTSDELTRIEKNLKDFAPALERLRAFPLTNADEPDFV